MTWTAAQIARALYHQFFRQRHMIVVPNCYFAGHEADMLVVHRNLKLIDVEIKISRADLKADLSKNKWWTRPDFWVAPNAVGVRREWPPRIWRHYFVAPVDIWKPELLDSIPAASGVIVIDADRYGTPKVKSVRRARSNPDAKPAEARDIVDLGRLANMRMWDALDGVRHEVVAA